MASEKAEIIAGLTKLVGELSSDTDANTLHSIADNIVSKAIALQKPDPYKKKTLAASTLELGAVMDMLGIGYRRYDPKYSFDLKDEIKEVQASDWCSEAINKLNSSRHHHQTRGEPFSRTLIDLLLCDRLLALDDDDADNILQVATEVCIRAEIPINKRTKYKAAYVSGKADYTLGYYDKRKTEAILIVIEAKKEGAGGFALPQTLCYLAGVQDARKKAGKLNVDLFGMISDSVEYRFIRLDCKRDAFFLRPLEWGYDNSRIVAFLDHILRSAIASSPHTTPVKTKNKQTRNYSGFLDDTFTRGKGSSSTQKDLEIKEGADEYDIIEKDGISQLVLSESAETKGGLG